MKNKILITGLLSIGLIINSFSQTCDGTLPFEEQNGILTIEMESGVINDSRWKIGTENETINGQLRVTNYLYWTGAESFSNLSNAPIVYKIKINNPGTYRFAWRMRVGMGTSKGEHNDAWLKIDGEDFYGIKDGNKVYPKPYCNSDASLTCAAGSSTQNFIKAFGNRLDWGFVTNTNDHVAHRVFVTFNEAKEYTITVDARSTYLFIDRMVLRRSDVSDSVAFDLANSESSCYNVLSLDNDNRFDRIKLYPNPTKGLVSMKNMPINSKLRLSNIQGATIREIEVTTSSESLDISDLSGGIYFISCTDNQSAFVKKIVKL
ncbi:T9SS type A sorting domain-containing protein [Tamlana sp. I1]|uniref:T9SS type A sorting domain-containing protein n=1 Tax=Tamlana sp. I1 TaxID=2762061 RepID=UPI00188EFCDB|nr:T9SS type A sorting domain-containing protein [Tamlana sp. I1]